MKKTMKHITQFAAGSIALGGLSMAAGKVGGASGLSAMSSMMPAIGSITIAGDTMRMANNLMPKKRRKLI